MREHIVHNEEAFGVQEFKENNFPEYFEHKKVLVYDDKELGEFITKAYRLAYEQFEKDNKDSIIRNIDHAYGLREEIDGLRNIIWINEQRDKVLMFVPLSLYLLWKYIESKVFKFGGGESGGAGVTRF